MLSLPIVENFLKQRELISDLANLEAELSLFGDWRNVLCGLFNSRAELLGMKHQFGECFGILFHHCNLK